MPVSTSRFDYHRIHVPIDSSCVARVTPWPAVQRHAPLPAPYPGFRRQERVVCEFDTRTARWPWVMGGALFVGTVRRSPGEINPPASRGGAAREIAAGQGLEFRRGDELGRFNMGSTVVLLWQRTAGEFAPGLAAGVRLRLGQLLAGSRARS